MIGIIGEAVNKIRSLVSDKNIDKNTRSKKIEQAVYQILGAIICCWLIIAISADKNNSSKISSTSNDVLIPLSDRKFSSPTTKEAYKIVWTTLNYNNSNATNALKKITEDIKIYVDTSKTIFSQLSSSEKEEVFTALFEKMSKQQKLILSLYYKIRQAADIYTSQRLILYLPSSSGNPYDIEEKSLDIQNLMTKKDVILTRLKLKELESKNSKLAALGALAYSDKDIRDKFYQKFEDIIASNENKIATKFQSFYKNFDNKSEKEQFYFCSGIAIASPDINNPPIIRPRDVPVDYVGLMQLYRDGYTVQVIMQENQNRLVQTNAHIENMMKSRAAQYFGWGSIQYGPLTDSELDIVDTGRLAAYFDVDIRNDKQLADKCNVMFNKMSNQSGETLETKGSAYINRLMTKYNQSEIRYYFTENQYLQQGSSLYGLYLSMSKPVYERNENIVLSVKWNEDNANCEILTDKVKEALTKNQFEIVENGISCSKDTTTFNVKLSAKIKTSKLGKISIPSIELDDDFSNSVDFTVKDTEALREALNTKNINAVKASLSSSGELNTIKIEGEHPVVHFIKDDTDFAKELIKLGASPDVIDKNGYTPLMYAVIRQNNELLDLLLSKKVDLNILDKKGRTAIMYATIKNNIYATKKLLEHKADLYKSKDKGWSAYRYAKELGHKEIEKLLNDFDYDELIIFTDKCDTCQQRKKIFEKIAENYKSLKIKYLSSSIAKQYLPSGNYYNPVILIRNSKKDIGQYITGWKGSEKQLEQIMYKD